ncbi:MAG: class I SAM-dependent methyltransferase [Verrucomicrobia bacterium]|nr:class I SAM-dependent methyltransferase [Verrucomicrobiota bacterium]
MDGGYDSGYKSCPCFWGRDPGKLVRHLANIVPDFSGLSVIDAGCGEGKNAAFLATCGATVHAFDVSEIAMDHAKKLWRPSLSINWTVADITEIEITENAYDIVVAYGLFHCLRKPETVRKVVRELQRATRPNGYHAIVALNSRFQDLRAAHPELSPCLLAHGDYLSFYQQWNLIVKEDVDLTETHPHNKISHTHSITRILAQKAPR